MRLHPFCNANHIPDNNDDNADDGDEGGNGGEKVEVVVRTLWSDQVSVYYAFYK